MGRFKAALVVVLVFAIGSTVFNIVGPKVLSTATTELFNGIVAKIDGSGGIDFDAIAQILLFTLGLYLLSAACSFVQGWIMSSVSQRTCYELRRAIAEKIDRMPMGYFERNSVGDTLSRITNDVDTLGPEPEPGRDPAHHVRHHHRRRARHDADHQPAHDARHRGHPAGVGGAHHGGGEALAEVLPGAAAHARRDQRPGGGDVLGPRHREGVQPRGRHGGQLQRDERAPVRTRRGRASSSAASCSPS